MLKLYSFSKVNKMARGHTRDLRVLWALEEMQLPFEIVGMDHPAKDLSAEFYHHINPFEQIPSIDDDGLVVTESGAILLYLARKSGKLIPADLAGEAQVMRWSFAAMNSLEIPLMSLMMIDWSEKPDACTGHREFLAGWAERHVSNLDGWLEKREWIATNDFTVADILMAHVLTGIKDGSPLAKHKHVIAYRDRCFARPAWKRAMESYMARVVAD
ncbi:MAG: glutathione S-transferase family protein [Ramlibacter sp.]|nr:glutathione S-transferase family protein [Ramlibacter sp.]